MQEQTKQRLAVVMEQAADEGTMAEDAIGARDASLATKRLLQTIALTAEAIETLAEFDGPLNALVNIAPNIAVYVNALEMVSEGDFDGALIEARGKPTAAPWNTDDERTVWMSAYGNAFACAVAVNKDKADNAQTCSHAEAVASLAVARLRTSNRRSW
jgi:hypothetical protein